MFQNSDMVLNDLEKEKLDLSFHSSGIDQCRKGNLYGPRTRRYHLIHFVISGKGILKIDGKIISVNQNQAFLIPAGCLASYQADIKTPWKYCWIGYQGTQATKYSNLLFPTNYIINSTNISSYERQILKMLACTDKRINLEINFSPEKCPLSFFSDAKTLSQHLLLNGLLKEMFANLLAEQDSDCESILTACYADRVKDYIDKHYNERLQIHHIADYLGLTPHYITLVFKRKYMVTPKNYLTSLRIEKAKMFLVDTEYPLQIIANAVGLENPFSFSRLFKKNTGISPDVYRKSFFKDTNL